MKVWLIQSCFVLFSLFFSHKTCAALSHSSCPRDQSLALIQLNNSFFVDCHYSPLPEAKTVSWKKGTDCCLWDGVTCDVKTGNVVGLNLGCSCLTGPFPPNSTLFLLRHLRQLNLAYNYFDMSRIPSQFGQLTGLTHLNISGSFFSGKIPLEISHLSKLVSLDISTQGYSNLMFEGLVFGNVVKNLTQLRHLLLSNVNMSSVVPTSFLNMSSYLTTLILEGSGLQGKFPEDVFHFPNLEKLCLNSFYPLNFIEKLCINEILFHFPNLEKICLDFFHGPYLENVFSFYVEFHGLEIKLPKTNWSGPLKSLEVSNSYLQELPDSIANLRSLEILDLSYSSLAGPIPAALGNLTQLRYLDLSRNNLSGLLPISVFNLTQVEFLDFSSNNLIGSLPSRVRALSRLRWLGFNGNYLTGRVPSWLFSLPSLLVLRLHNNKFTGTIDQSDKVAPLESVDLSNNEIEGPIPVSFSQLVNLTILHISSNKLSGSFELDKLSKLGKLEELSFSNNPLLSLTSASNVNFSLPNLSTLNLSCCNISEFPNFVRNLSGLTSLDLSHNRIRVIEADVFLKHQSLRSLYLSHNRIRVIEADMFVKLISLEYLDLSHNSPLSLTNNNNLSLVLPHLDSLSLSACNITEFSNFLTTQEGLISLDLSNNIIQGQITKQETNRGTNLQFVDLSDNLLTVVEYSSWKNIKVLKLGSNQLEGPLLPPPPSASVLLISENRLTGEIPPSICNLNYSAMDVVLDLSRNNLSGAIPRCLGLSNISVLDLQKNHLHGKIPDFCAEGNYRLQTLNLNNNEFDGPLPKSFAYCHNLEVLNLGNNKINDTFPHWLGTLPQLQVLVLRANYFHGQIFHLKNGSHFSTLRILDLSHNDFSGFLPTTYFKSFHGMMSLANVQMRYMEGEYYQDSMVVTMKGVDIELERILTIFATLDMSSNRFEGTIPETIENLVSLQVLNFSHNHLTGHIPSSLVYVAALESLDLSCNELVGEIPSQLVGLNFLEWLNLSENHLVGLIPQGNQFNTFLNDSYFGNPGLCGFPVSKSCGHSEPSAPGFDEHDDDSAFRLDWKFVMMGYGCGLVFGFSAGYIMMTVRKPKWLVGMIQRAGSTVLRRFKRYH